MLFQPVKWGKKHKSYFQVPKVVTHIAEKFSQLKEKQQQTYGLKTCLMSGGAESDSARVCYDHLMKAKAIIILQLNFIHLAQNLRNTEIVSSL